MAELKEQRTQQAERLVEEFLSLPFISEFVFRSPQTLDATQREVADFLVADGNIGILISQKCQEDPSSRVPAKVESWARKKAKEAVSQLQGALRTAFGKPVWCIHPRRGRVDFLNGLPKIDHGIVLVEVFQSVDLQPEAAGLPLDFQNAPVSYLSLNDFLNLARELRTTPELLEYLNARRSLPLPDLRVVGDEKSLFEYYLLNNGSLHGCQSRADARKATVGRQEQLHRILKLKAQSNYYSMLIEHVADELGKRNPGDSEVLSPDVLAKFEPLSGPRGYLKMQGVLADLRLGERAELGRAFHSAIDQTNNFAYLARYLDSKPRWVFVFASCKNVDRGVLQYRMKRLMDGAMSFFGKDYCLMIADRDGEAYEVALGHLASHPTVEERRSGDHFFGHLRISHGPVSLVPNIIFG